MRLIPAALIIATLAVLLLGMVERPQPVPVARPAAETIRGAGAIEPDALPASLAPATATPAPAAAPRPRPATVTGTLVRATAKPKLRIASQIDKPRGAQSVGERPAKPLVPSKSAPTTGRLSGTASWFCLSGRSACTRGYPPSCLCAAAGPALRAALGPSWRGSVVTVSTARASVRIQLSDWCQCPGGRVADLYSSVWFGLGESLSQGLIDVKVTW